MPGGAGGRRRPHWTSSSKPREILKFLPWFGALVRSCGGLSAKGEDTTRLGNGTLVRTVLLTPIQAMGNETLGRTLR